MPGGSGNGPLILAHSGRHGISNLPHASRVSCSELLGRIRLDSLAAHLKEHLAVIPVSP